MLPASDLLRAFANLLRRRTGAVSASIYLPATKRGGEPPVLVHSELQHAVEELKNPESAEDLDSRYRATVSQQGGDPREGGIATLAGREPWCWLLRVPTPRFLPRMLPPSRDSVVTASAAEAAWIGLRLPPGVTPRWTAESNPEEESGPWWSWLLGLGAGLGWHVQELAGVLQDPVSQLLARAGFQRQLLSSLERMQKRGRPLTLVLINPQDFDVVNERFGREIGNQVIREVGQRLQDFLRSTDLIGRYGGAVFAVALPDTSLEESSPRVQDLKVRLSERPYRNGSVRLGFCFGVAAATPAPVADPEEEILDLIRRADQALSSAKQSGSGRTVFSYSEAEPAAGSLDRLSGIFTADLAKDYRNMLLLWDTVTIVSANSSFDDLAGRVVERLFATFKPDQVALFSTDSEDEVVGVYRRCRESREGTMEEEAEPSPETDEVTTLEQSLIQETRRKGRATQRRVGEGSETQEIYALPLLARNVHLGALLLSGGDDWPGLDSSDLIFLRALTSHVAVAIDRARLAELEKQRQEREKRDLRAELKELQRALQEAKLVYSSQQMEELLATVRKVAQTDATVLITGESGTGKELVARTLHELSGRRAQPLVVVDCAAIADSLIDSELFGYEKGAFTGAERKGIGRLAEADGGTVLLDEIGELPLAVQAKLLRFVQEKQITPVGSTRSRSVDVRLIAATNRDLGAEANAGQFREDLYYRLNVVRLVVPPLRDRPDDVLALAHHFLRRAGIQYQKGILRFSAEAERLLVRHRWPGNVRELENRIRQAVILAQAEVIQPGDLELSGLPEPPPRPRAASPRPGARSATGRANGRKPPASPARDSHLVESPAGPGENGWQRLQSSLGYQVEWALREPNVDAFPLGRWLREDLLLEASELADGIQTRTARLLGIPETTCRRRLRKVQSWTAGGEPPRPDAWKELRPLLRRLLKDYGDTGEDLGQRAREVLLQEVAARLPGQDRRGAALMGVSSPTYKRWLEDQLD